MLVECITVIRRDLPGRDPERVQDLDVGRVEDGPAGVAQPRGQVELLAVQEERLVEHPDLVEHLAGQQHAGAGDPIHLALGGSVPPLHVVPAAEPIARQERPQEAVSHRVDDARERPAARIHGPVRVADHRPHDPRARVRPRDRDVVGERSRPPFRVGVQQQHVRRIGLPDALVPRRREVDVLRVLDQADPRMRGDRARVAAVDRRVVDHQHVDVDVAAMRLERRQAPFEVVAGVVVHDDDGELRRAANRHRCGVCATSTMPTMMQKTPAHRSAGTVSFKHEPVGQQDQHVRERGERIGERQRRARQDREPHDRREPEQEQASPDGRRREDVLDRRRRQLERARVVGDLVHAVLQRELGAGGEQHGEQDQSDQHGGSLPFRSGDVLGRSGVAHRSSTSASTTTSMCSCTRGTSITSNRYRWVCTWNR